MDNEELRQLGRTLMGLGTVWIIGGLILGATFFSRDVGLGLALGGILPLLLGLGLFRRGGK